VTILEPDMASFIHVIAEVYAEVDLFTGEVGIDGVEALGEVLTGNEGKAYRLGVHI
jgi:hypothetical protein